MEKSQYGNALISGVSVFLFSEADALFREGPVTTTDDYDIIVASVDDAFDEGELFLVRRREQLHSCRDTVELQKRFADLAALVLEIKKGGTDEDLVAYGGLHCAFSLCPESHQRVRAM